MKKLLLAILIILNTSIYAQRKNRSITWFFISAKGAYGTSLLFNKATFDDPNIDYAYYSPSYSFGGEAGFMINDIVGLSAEITSNTLSEKYTVNASEPYTLNANFNYFEYAFYLNLKSSTGLYLSFGPKFSKLKKASSEYKNIHTDPTDKLIPNLQSVVINTGFTPIRAGNTFELKTGIRAVYTFTPMLQNSNYFIPIPDPTLYQTQYSDNKTLPIQLLFTVETKLYWGYFGRASCGKYRFIPNF